MEEATKQFVRQRAQGRCEYCGISETYFAQLFQIEHIVARSHRGESEPANLALACRRCNLHKGPNLAGIDPVSGELTRLFDPREDVWSDHFEQDSNGEIRGLSDVGRTTVFVLAMNDERRVELRRAIAMMSEGFDE